MDDARRLGEWTAQMHLALAQAGDDPAFAPEPLSIDDQRLFAERTRAMAEETFAMLQAQLPAFSDESRRQAERVLPCKRDLAARLRRFAERPIEIAKIRCHGDYHLGQVLVADGDFTIIDFEGEPARPLAERRQKQLALRDVAGMIRSFHYASCSAAARAAHSATPEEKARIGRWARDWHATTCDAFLGAYRRAASGAAFVPRSDDELAQLLDACLLEKAIYELRYELNNRPDWVYLPLAALVDLLGDTGSAGC
jgi:maltose alpha-D-glucosyltransferase/alpha-amylase